MTARRTFTLIHRWLGLTTGFVTLVLALLGVLMAFADYIGRLTGTGHHTPFFAFLKQGHVSLWLPAEIGKPLEGYCMLGFVLICLSGLALWWRTKIFCPRTWKNPKALSCNLHIVIGFWLLVPLLYYSITGALCGLPWLRDCLGLSESYRTIFALHKGAFLGNGGKLIVGIVSLALAVLPVTGLFIWKKKRR